MTALLSLAGVSSVVCLGAHPDDIEIGAGATLRTLLGAGPGVVMRWLVLTGTPQRAGEARASAASYFAASPGSTLQLHDFADGRLPYDDPAAVKLAVAELGAQGRPDLVLAPRRDDAHQDHRFVAEVAWQVFRGVPIWEYEIVKWDADLLPPNVYVPVTEDDAAAKIAGLFEHFGSQRSKSWFTEETFRSLLRIRGIEAGSETGYAEAFHVRKIVVGSLATDR